MAILCAVPLCYNRFDKENKISFHKFPKDPVMREKWVKAIGLKKPVFSWTAICSKHFNEDSFLKGYVNRRKLVPTSVPSIFNTKIKFLNHDSPKGESSNEEEGIISDNVVVVYLNESVDEINDVNAKEVVTGNNEDTPSENKTVNCDNFKNQGINEDSDPVDNCNNNEEDINESTNSNNSKAAVTPVKDYSKLLGFHTYSCQSRPSRSLLKKNNIPSLKTSKASMGHQTRLGEVVETSKVNQKTSYYAKLCKKYLSLSQRYKRGLDDKSERIRFLSKKVNLLSRKCKRQEDKIIGFKKLFKILKSNKNVKQEFAHILSNQTTKSVIKES